MHCNAVSIVAWTCNLISIVRNSLDPHLIPPARDKSRVFFSVLPCIDFADSYSLNRLVGADPRARAKLKLYGAILRGIRAV